MRKILLGLFVSVSALSSALADGDLDKILSDFDKKRLSNFEKSQASALSEGLRGGTSEEIDILTKALSGKNLPFSEDYDLTGNWKCRVIKVGGGLPITPYGWFKCRISDDGTGWFVEKVSGSQRVSGRLYTKSETELVFVGAGHVNDDPPRQYRQVAEHDQVAIVTRRAREKLVFEFPEPQFESGLDVLVMERAK